jgi:hypothetical protein
VVLKDDTETTIHVLLNKITAVAENGLPGGMQLASDSRGLQYPAITFSGAACSPSRDL